MEKSLFGVEFPTNFNVLILNMKLRNMLSVAFLFIPHVLHAELRDYAKIESDCRKENAGVINNSVVMGCAEIASDAAKKDMNIVYQRIYKIIASRNIPDITEKFELSQKSWLVLRENGCDVQGFMIGSPMYSICRMDMNITRVNELNEMLEQIQE